MKVKVHYVSGPAHQLMKDGVPCDQWVITVQLTIQERGACANLRRYYAIFAFDTQEQGIEEASKYHIGEIIDMPEDVISWVKGGKIVSISE